MAGSRSFDDDRWPDEEQFACCFICGKKVDPKDPQRGTVACGQTRFKVPLTCHLPCAEKTPPKLREILHLRALNQMADRSRSMCA